VTAIPLRRRLPGAFSNLPGRPDPDMDPEDRFHSRRSELRAVPIRSCSRWGLPCRLRCRRRGALLPHRFTLTAPSSQVARDGRGGLFSVALSLGLRPPDVIRHRMSMEPGLSSRAHLSALARAAVQPTDGQGMGRARANVKTRTTIALTPAMPAADGLKQVCSHWRVRRAPRGGPSGSRRSRHR
jgi:hypothetical protein